MTPGAYNITIYRGIDFNREIIWTGASGVAVPITGWTAQCDVRVSPNQEVAFSFTTDIPTGTDGKTTLALTKAQTDVLNVGTYYYDLVFTNDSSQRVGPLISGTVTVVELNSQIS